ncbi:MAG: DNA repair exonuclease [Promethearchaeota archaeon]|nr:MAG: DNA repair exonuclease [Candidatus Lokiarchaeota archaeon]
MVQILHTADFHLDPKMSNFLHKDRDRREDFERNFDKIIEFSLKERPDIILISGDLFDSINPRNPIRNHVITQFKKIHSKKIKIFAIGGNHDVPRSVENALSPISILNTIEYLDFIEPESQFISKRELQVDNLKINIFGESYEVLNMNQRDPLDELKFPKIDGDINIFMVHGSIGLFKYRYPGDYIIKEINIPEEIDYVAAGHLHDHIEKVRHNPNLGTNSIMVYPGSIEFLSFNEDLKESKGFMFLEFDKNGLLNKEFIKIETRPIGKITIPIKNTDEDIYGKVIQDVDTLKNREKILKIILDGKIKVEQISSIKTSKLIEYGDDNFYKLFLDTYSKLEFETSELKLPEKEHATPREIFIQHMDNLIEEEDNEKLRQTLESAKSLSLEKLKKFGVD